MQSKGVCETLRQRDIKSFGPCPLCQKESPPGTSTPWLSPRGVAVCVAVLAPHKLPNIRGNVPGRQAPSHHPAKGMQQVLIPDTRGRSVPTMHQKLHCNGGR